MEYFVNIKEASLDQSEYDKKYVKKQIGKCDAYVFRKL